MKQKMREKMKSNFRFVPRLISSLFRSIFSPQHFSLFSSISFSSLLFLFFPSSSFNLLFRSTSQNPHHDNNFNLSSPFNLIIICWFKKLIIIIWLIKKSELICNLKKSWKQYSIQSWNQTSNEWKKKVVRRRKSLRQKIEIQKNLIISIYKMNPWLKSIQRNKKIHFFVFTNRDISPTRTLLTNRESRFHSIENDDEMKDRYNTNHILPLSLFSSSCHIMKQQAKKTRKKRMWRTKWF